MAMIKIFGQCRQRKLHLMRVSDVDDNKVV